MDIWLFLDERNTEITLLVCLANLKRTVYIIKIQGNFGFKVYSFEWPGNLKVYKNCVGFAQFDLNDEV